MRYDRSDIAMCWTSLGGYLSAPIRAFFPDFFGSGIVFGSNPTIRAGPIYQPAPRSDRLSAALFCVFVRPLARVWMILTSSIYQRHPEAETFVLFVSLSA
jgi:hypothetical protein